MTDEEYQAMRERVFQELEGTFEGSRLSPGNLEVLISKTLSAFGARELIEAGDAAASEAVIAPVLDEFKEATQIRVVSGPSVPTWTRFRKALTHTKGGER